jgi:hypothetical protein
MMGHLMNHGHSPCATKLRSEECGEPGRIAGRGASLASGGEGGGFGGGPKEGVHISGRLSVLPEDKATNLAESAESARDRARRAAVVPPRLPATALVQGARPACAPSAGTRGRPHSRDVQRHRYGRSEGG